MTEDAKRIDGRSLRYKGRREELLAAVIRYILANGVGDLAMRPMAQAVGVSHATLLNHFGTKENLVTEAIATMNRVAIPAAAQVPMRADGRIAAAEALTVWWEVWSQPEYWPAVRVNFEVYGLAMLQPDKYAAFLEQYIGGWTDLFRSFVRSAGCPPEEVESAATFLLASTRGLQSDLVGSGDAERVNGAFRLFIEIVADRQARWLAAAA